MSETPDLKPVRVVAGINVLDLAGGLILMALGVGVAAESLTYSLGSTRNVGPGVFPMLLGVVLAGLGMVVVLEGRTSRAVLPGIPWRAILAVSAGLGAFALLIDTAGAYVAIFALVFLSGLAERQFRPLALVLVVLGLCAFITVLTLSFRGLVSMDLLPEL